MALTLYHNDMSVCAQRVRLTLAEKDLAFESRHLDLRAGDQKDPQYLKLNPNGYVPTLVHDDFVLNESSVICDYIDDAFPAPALAPSDAHGKARMRGFTKFIDAEIFPATGVVSNSIAFHHQYAPEVYARMEAARPGWLARFRNHQKGVDNPAFPDAIRRLDKMLADMEAALAAHGKPWLAGEMFTAADIGNAPFLTRLDHLQFLGPMTAHRPLTTKWYERLKARPGYQEAVATWFNAKYLPLMSEKGVETWPRVRELLAA
jgi:glutathione S-transferase